MIAQMFCYKPIIIYLLTLNKPVGTLKTTTIQEKSGANNLLVWLCVFIFRFINKSKTPLVTVRSNFHGSSPLTPIISITPKNQNPNESNEEESDLILESEKTGTILYIAGFVFLGLTVVLGTLIIVDQIDHELVSNYPIINQIVDSTYSVWDSIKNWFGSNDKPSGDLPPKSAETITRSASGSSVNTVTQGDYTSLPKNTSTIKDHSGCSYPTN